MRKGQGISINVVVIAAIALLILVILSVIVLRAVRNINTTTQVCGSESGETCAAKDVGCGPSEFEVKKACLSLIDNKEDPTKICCRK